MDSPVDSTIHPISYPPPLYVPVQSQQKFYSNPNQNDTTSSSFDDLNSPKHNSLPADKMKIRFVCISDTHCLQDSLYPNQKLPDGDILIHCG